MAATRTVALILVAMIAVAAAYDPIADNKVPSPKSALKASNSAGRKMLQWVSSMGAGMGGVYHVGHPFWMPGLPQSPRFTKSEELSNQRRFELAQK